MGIRIRLATRLALVSALLGVPSFAGEIKTLFSTGVSGDNGTTDANYTIVLRADGNPSTLAYITTAPPSWLLNDAASTWIAPQLTYAGGQSDSVGNYAYRTTFDLTQFDSSTASISLQVATDDVFDGYTLNGNFVATGYYSFSSLSQVYTINSGFVSGINSLEFLTDNSGGATGFRAVLSGTANPIETSATPEPNAFLLISAGVALLAGRIRRRRK